MVPITMRQAIYFADVGGGIEDCGRDHAGPRSRALAAKDAMARQSPA